MAEKTELDLAAPDAQAVRMGPPQTGTGFLFGTPDNFTLLIGDFHISVLGGKPCSTGRFKKPRDEQKWITWHLAFQRHVLERLERYAELRLAELQTTEAPTP
jgi:hypothetical protein